MSCLNKEKEKAIADFWTSSQTGTFLGVDKVRLAYVKIVQSSSCANIVIASGRSEGYLKYQELAYDLAQRGYNIFIHDHRGQGLSQRLLENPHKGYVKNFDHYADDLATFIRTIVHESADQKPTFLLAHSMGSAIALRTLQKYPHLVSRATLCSPMIAINFGKIPNWIAKTIIKIGLTINQCFSTKPWYFIGHKNYQPAAFENNPLMDCPARFERFIHLYQLVPRLQLGGVTYQWLAQALRVNKRILQELSNIKDPITVLQASDDKIVDNKAQNDFCRQLHHESSLLCQPHPIVISGAKHELLFDIDARRDQALAHIYQSFETVDVGS